MFSLKLPTIADAFGGGAAPHRRASYINFVRDDVDQRFAVGELRRQALHFAAHLRELGVARGERIPLAVPTSPEFVVSFFGIMFAGAIPCPIALPMGFGALELWTARLSSLLEYLEARRVVVDGSAEVIARSASPVPEVLVPSPVIAALPAGSPPEPVPIAPDDVAFIQCTSGTTGAPKGVVLTHACLTANAHQLGLRVGLTEHDVTVSWLPLYHDMGLIGYLFIPLYWGCDLHLLSPIDFIRKPASWLRAFSRHRGTVTSAPNFGYRYTAMRAKDEQLVGVDLSNWRAAYCGAEPIDPSALTLFQERFARYGLRRHAMVPCYGLAEASLGVSMGVVGDELRIDRLDRERLTKDREAVPGASSGSAVIEIVGCGRPLEGTSIRILDDADRPLPEGRVGRVVISGPSLMQGYHRLPEATQAVVRDGWLDTGDLGYLRDGELYITGRIKDTIIIRGRCYSPNDFEWAAERVEGVCPGGVVAFGLFEASIGTEVLCVVCETTITDEDRKRDLAEHIASRVSEQTGTRPEIVHLVGRDWVPRTTSGKIQHGKAREMFLAQRG